MQASATPVDGLTGAVSGSASFTGADGYYPTNPDPFAGFEENHRHVGGVGLERPRIGLGDDEWCRPVPGE